MAASPKSHPDSHPSRAGIASPLITHGAESLFWRASRRIRYKLAVFISHYELRIEFDKEAEKEAFDTAYPSPQLPTQLALDLQEPRHIYAPLLQGADNQGVKKAFRFRALSISPDALNAGERKFVEDLHVFLGNPVNQGRLRKFDFYLMRNVESLRAVGVYLDTETRAYYRSIRLTHSCSNRNKADFLLRRGRFRLRLATKTSAFLSTG